MRKWRPRRSDWHCVGVEGHGESRGGGDQCGNPKEFEVRAHATQCDWEGWRHRFSASTVNELAETELSQWRSLRSLTAR